jgi:hypothetical protein
MGAIVDGDWDQSTDRFQDLDVYEALCHVLADNGSWPDTAWYQDIAARIERGECLWNCSDKAAFDARCAEIESIYESMRLEGYKTQSQLVSEGRTDQARDEIAVGVGRTGELYFTDGAHRLSCAKLLGLPEIPVQISVRHPEWIKFRRQVMAEAESYGGELYQKAMHPDLETIAHSHGCEDRFAMIHAALKSPPGRLLDIGSNWGYFCHRFEALGFDCVAVEQDPSVVHYMTTIRDAMRRQFRVTSESILGTPSIVAEPYQVVLALNIFHHFIKTKERFEQLEELLDALRCEEMFIECHTEGETQMAEAYRNFSGEELVRFVSERSDLPNIILLGTVSDGRSVYQLTR